jgi:DNA-binding response OmpR family regulator
MKTNILVVDDLRSIRLTLGRVLEDEGYTVIMAENGYQAIEAAKQTSFALIFMDIKMPGINGERVRLTPIEFRLLALLMPNAGRILTHRQLLEGVWGWEYIDDVDYVRIYIWHLRQKIEPDPAQPKYIITEPGVGYYFRKADRE